MPETRHKDTPSPLFSWLSFSRSTYERQVQMNPVSAMMQTQTMSTVRRLVAGAGMIAIVLAVIGGTVYKLQQGSNLRASFNLMQSVYGTVEKVDTAHNSFSILYGSSFDDRISSLRKSKWTVLLPPGTTLTAVAPEKSPCYIVDDMTGNLSNALKAPCSTVVTPGNKLFIEYLYLTASKTQLVARAIIGEK
jgi:hypothetical protein